MSVEPPFGDVYDPGASRCVIDGIRPWIVEEVNQEINRFYENNDGTPTIADADDHYFYWQGEKSTTLSEPPHIHQLPKEYCVYILKCEQKGFDKLSSYEHTKESLTARAKEFGYEYSDDWMKAVFHSTSPRYVGLTTNPYARIHEHTELIQHTCKCGECNPSGAKFTAMFPPDSIQRIEWVDDKQTAKQLEQSTANSLHEEGNYFVHPRPE